MENLLIEEEYINKTEGYRLGGSGVYETYTDNKGKLFLSLQREFGKCTGKVYIDTENDGAKSVGWTFEKRVQYEDTKEYYTQEVWVTLHTSQPTKKTEYHYA